MRIAWFDLGICIWKHLSHAILQMPLFEVEFSLSLGYSSHKIAYPVYNMVYPFICKMELENLEELYWR